jgi:hypothetical protein
MASFQGKYEVVSALSDGESRSFRALQISSGRPVLVHHLAAGQTPSPQPDLASLIFKFLRCASAEESRNFLDMGEDEGRIFVVTADVPECLDLRQWLQSVTEAHAGKEGDAQLAGEVTPDLSKIEFTRNFTTKVLRQISHFPVSEPAPPSPAPPAAQPPVPAPEKSPGVLIPPPEIPAASSEVSDHGPTDFSRFWEKSSPAEPAGHAASIPTPPASPKGAESPSKVSEDLADYLTGRSSSNIQDAPTEPMRTLKGQSAERERTPAADAGPAEAKGDAGRFADAAVLAPTEVMKPPPAPREAEVSKLSPQPGVPLVAAGPETQTPLDFAGLLVEKDKAPLQAAALSSTPDVDEEKEGEGKLAENVPPRPSPKGFEVVFQSSKPRSHPTLSGAPDQSGIMTAPVPIVPGPGPEEAEPTAAGGLPLVPPPAASPVAGRIGASPAKGFPNVPGGPRPAVGVKKEPSAPPSPPFARKAFAESEKATRLVPSPPVPATGLSPVPGGAQPGEYTRMIENVKAIAGPLPTGVPPAGGRPPANLTGPAPPPSRAPYLPAPVPPPYREPPPRFRPAPYIAKDTPAHPAGMKRKVWVPMLILGGLFLVTVALLLFFAFKP